MVIPPGITSSWTRKLPEEGLFRRELLAHRRGIHPRNGIPPGITSSGTLIQTVKFKIREKSSSGSAAPNFLYKQCKLFKKLKYENVCKIKNKSDKINLLKISYLSNKIKKDTKHP
jgi:hypothetical protein